MPTKTITIDGQQVTMHKTPYGWMSRPQDADAVRRRGERIKAMLHAWPYMKAEINFPMGDNPDYYVWRR